MRPVDFIGRLQAEMPGEHFAHPPLTAIEQEAEQQKLAQLPADFVDMLRLANGIEFWVMPASQHGYLSLLSLKKIENARSAMWGHLGEAMEPDWELLPHSLAISADMDGSDFIVLDTDNGRYYAMDSCGADLSRPAGTNVEELLDYLWAHWVHALRTLNDNRTAI